MIFVKADHLYEERMCFVDINLLILLISLCETGKCTPECKEKYKGCCAGYFWNVSTERCEACMPGYFGENCTQQCPYPSYGIRCQGGLCDCDEDLCDVSTGCKIQTTDLQTTTRVNFSTGGENANNTTSNTATNYTLISDSSSFSPINEILLYLIIIFGALDIILFCAYSALCMRDRRRYRAHEVGQNGYISGDNTVYENVEILPISSGINLT